MNKRSECKTEETIAASDSMVFGSKTSRRLDKSHSRSLGLEVPRATTLSHAELMVKFGDF